MGNTIYTQQSCWILLYKFMETKFINFHDTFVQCCFFSGTFIIYAVINAAAIIFVVMVVPETKGRSLEQIQADINA